MAIAVASKTTAGFANTTLTFTAPTGIQVGDLLVCVIVGNTTPTTPAGWTYRSGAGSEWLNSVYEKIADSSDASAGSFSWTISSFSAGCLMRVTGATPTPFDAIRNGQNASSVGVTALTPAQDGSLLILFKSSFSTNDAVEITHSGYAINGTNPAWTEQLDASAPLGGDRIGIGVATAVQATKAEISTLTVVASAEANTATTLGVYTPSISASGTSALHSADADLFVPAGSAGVMGTADLVSGGAELFDQEAKSTSPARWIAPVKGPATWIKEPKP